MALKENKYPIIYAKKPLHSCSLGGAFIGCQGINNSDFIIHGSSGCAFSMKYGLAQHWKSFIPSPVTNLCEDSLVFGSNNLLEKALTEFVNKSNSNVTFVFSTCSSEIIGEDYSYTCKKISKKFHKDIIFIETGGSNGLLYGYDNFIYSLLKEYVFFKKNDNTYQINILGIIPLYNMYWKGDMEELRQLMSLINLNVHSFIANNLNIEKLKEINNSNLIINIDKNVCRKSVNYLKKQNYNIFESDFAPIGFKYTKQFLMNIIKVLKLNNKYIENIKEKEIIIRQKLLNGYDFSKVMFQSAKCAVIGTVYYVVPLVEFLVNELGITCKLIAFTEYANENAINELQNILKDKYYDTILLNNQDDYYIRNEIQNLKLNLVFGRSLDRINKEIVHITWQFPSSDNYVFNDQSTILGYNGIINITDIIINEFCKKWY